MTNRESFCNASSRLPLVWGIDRFTTGGSGTAGSCENDSSFTRECTESADAVPWCCNRLSACGESPHRSFIRRSSHEQDDPHDHRPALRPCNFDIHKVQDAMNRPKGCPPQKRPVHMRLLCSVSLQKGKQTFVGSLLFRRHHWDKQSYATRIQYHGLDRLFSFFLC